eukprot:9166264-Pyramimonas_sp.AAC.1
MDKCLFCSEQFPSVEKCSAHMKTCMHMPYNMRLSRTRYTVDTPSADCACKHCGTKFTTPKGCSRHAHNCGARRTLHKLPLNTLAYHPTAFSEAQIVLHQHRGYKKGLKNKPRQPTPAP